MRQPAPPPRNPSAPALRRWLLILAALLVAGSIQLYRGSRRGSAPARPTSTAGSRADGAALDPEHLRAFTALESAEREADRTVWALERQAEAHAAVVEQLWESLNAATNTLEVLRDAPIASLQASASSTREHLAHGIERISLQPGSGPLPWLEWKSRLDSWRAEGWRLVQSEWRHVRFEPATGPNAARDTSWFDVRLDAERLEPRQRAQIRARLRVTWPRSGESGPAPGFGDLVVEEGDCLWREGAPPFETAFVREYAPFPRTSWIDPVIVRDLDRDGSPEMLWVARNLLLRRTARGDWEEQPLAKHHPGLLFTAVLADFDGDGFPDLLVAVRTGLVLLRGDAHGRFDTPPEPAWSAPERFAYAQAMTCGDIDGDGDTDVFVGQYRTPYEGGQMPTPYFDARDGPPAYLLRNEGLGRFTDVTAGSGLERNRHRRSYGASFVDLDDDGDLDLVVTSDFAGMEVYANGGRGTFSEITARWFEDTRAFGMSHTFSDFDADGRLDVLLVGMPQYTADRLDALGLERPGFESWRQQRPRMAFGSRLFLGREGGWDQRPSGRGLARAGWAWSAPAFDLDHDRFPEVFVVNGHETRRSVRDYETEFWTQDIYLPPATPAAVANAFFAAKFAATRAAGWSYGGYDKNRLFLNRGGTNFVDVGFLFGVALEADSRNAVAEDFDGDGSVDLLASTFEIHPRPRQTVRLYLNRLQPAGHWVGLRLPEGRGIPSPEGALLTLRDAGGTRRQTHVVGDGYRSQAQPVFRLGLGLHSGPVSYVVRWPGGWEITATNVPVDRILALPAPTRNR